jgi:L-amino acid N-acyltransferase YncA
MKPILRLATERDAEQILEIYRPFCADSPVSFELEPPSLDEMRRRIAKVLTRLPWLVCEEHGKILGYVYASPHRERTGYQWSVDVAVYIREGHRRAGIGRALYTALFKLLALQGFFNVYAGITLPNPASVGLHEAMGFRPVGVYRHVGYKCDAWHDVGWWHLVLQEHVREPAPPRTFRHVQGSPEWQAALEAGLATLQARGQ